MDNSRECETNLAIVFSRLFLAVVVIGFALFVGCEHEVVQPIHSREIDPLKISRDQMQKAKQRQLDLQVGWPIGIVSGHQIGGTWIRKDLTSILVFAYDDEGGLLLWCVGGHRWPVRHRWKIADDKLFLSTRDDEGPEGWIEESIRFTSDGKHMTLTDSGQYTGQYKLISP